MRLTKLVLLVLIALLLGCATSTAADEKDRADLHDYVVVFLGASITNDFYYPVYDWDNFFPDYDFYKVIVAGTPDKSSGFDAIAALNPDIVVFKECGAYFDEGGDSDHPFLHSCMQAIADFCVSINATPVPATTLPIDPGYDNCTQAQLDDIIEYNVWLRSWAATNGWTVMEYYDAIAGGDGQLPADRHVGDGLHPNENGYINYLGPIVVPTLEGLVSAVTEASMGWIKATFH